MSAAEPRLRLRQGRCGGLTLIELMISMTLGLMVMAAATALLLSAKTGYLAQGDEGLIQDSGRYALEQIARAVRQAAYENWDAAQAPLLVDASTSPNISGRDAGRLKSTSAGIDPPLLKPVNGSDILAVRFFGAADGSMLNCAGFAVAAPAAGASADDSRGWSIFYVAEDGHGVPQLYCKYQGKKAWQAQSIAEGVESFQVLYGLDSDGDGLANRFLAATALDAMDAALVPANKNSKTAWKKVVAVKVALLLRGNHGVRADTPDSRYDLFGKDYADANADTDKGVRIDETAIPAALRNRLRKVFSTTIQLRNRSAGSMA